MLLAEMQEVASWEELINFIDINHLQPGDEGDNLSNRSPSFCRSICVGIGLA